MHKDYLYILKRSLSRIINPYEWIIRVRNFFFDKGYIKSISFSVPIINIGNITVGGTGKTPHIELLVKLLEEKYHIALLSRGYKRKTNGFYLADDSSSANTIGDEPYQIKLKFPNITVAVDGNRVKGVNRLLELYVKPEVILLDDAFQHRYIKPGLNILLVDYYRPIWKDAVIPMGRLREPISGIERADIIIITKTPSDISQKETEIFQYNLQTNKGIPIFFSYISYGDFYKLFPSANQEDEIFPQQGEILLITGIARPQSLCHEIKNRGYKFKLMRFPDHHNFTNDDIKSIIHQFSIINNKKKNIVTTQKDAARLGENVDIPQYIRDRIYVLPIEIKIRDKQDIFNQAIFDYVRKDSRDNRISTK